MKDWFKNNFNYYFIVLVLMELAFGHWFTPGRVITKPLLLISLMGFYVLSSTQVDWLFLTALFFAFLGDTFLLSDGYFLFGLGSFLIMQLLYAYCFYKQRGPLTLYKRLGIGVIAILTAGMLYTIMPDLGQDLKIPVIIYSASIGLMAITAIARTGQRDGYQFIFFGVISFLISDSLLGLGKFGGAATLAGLLVMPTYIIAQYLIVIGYLQYESGNNAPRQT